MINEEVVGAYLIGIAVGIIICIILLVLSTKE